MEVFILVLLFSVLTTKGAVAQDGLDWDGFGEADGSLYELKPLSIIGFNTEQSSTYSKNTRSSKGVDGDIENGFFHTKDDERPFWTVQLKEEHCIGRVTLFNRKELCCTRLANAVVRAGVSRFYNANGRCGVPVTARQAEKPGGVIDVYCNPPLLASEVNVVLPNKEFLHLREVMLQEYPIQRCHQQERRLSTLSLPTEQSSEYDAAKYSAERAADGFINKFVYEGFSHTGQDFDPWWRVDLLDTHCISKVVLFNRASSSKRLADAVVRAGTNKNIHKNAQCGSAITADQAKIPGGDLAVYCQRPLKARYVSVNIPGRKEWLHLREVEIYELDVDPCESDERDVSLIGKPTKQSSLLGNKYSPVTAADGNEDTKLSPEHICTHTKEEDNPWWMVDLQDKRCISKVVLLNRGDCCSKYSTQLLY
ncbi:uncharacterized protein [Asterias amurensis]|uniref:uncharacterized protein n=1 Tax=Asterias amurensis TaxID=7602 RepID=UPI003AB7F1E7